MQANVPPAQKGKEVGRRPNTAYDGKYKNRNKENFL